MKAHNIQAVCSGGLSVHYRKIKPIFEQARKINPRVINVVGGGIFSSEPQVMMQSLEVDIGIVGEGEETIVELFHVLSSN